jgi:hypothetical protein
VNVCVSNLEKFGPNPSLIEMTAITSSYGAEAQYWHDDVIPTAFAIKYALVWTVVQCLHSVRILQKKWCYWRAQDRTIVLAVAWMLYCDGFQVVGEDGH